MSKPNYCNTISLPSAPVNPAQSSGFMKLDDDIFSRLQEFLEINTGIHYGTDKKALFASRLSQRVKVLKVSGFREYMDLLTAQNGRVEIQHAIDLLTTNETYFFREKNHFTFLKERILSTCYHTHFRALSAAASNGAEAYSLAMVLESHPRVGQWEVVGTDISTRMVEQATRGVYPILAKDRIIDKYLKRYCLKGTGKSAGNLKINSAIRDRVSFHHGNLTGSMPKIGLFDVIFLRNVLIYFNHTKRSTVIQNLLPMLRSGGYFMVGHAETLKDLNTPLKLVAPTIYQAPGPGRNRT